MNLLLVCISVVGGLLLAKLIVRVFAPNYTYTPELESDNPNKIRYVAVRSPGQEDDAGRFRNRLFLDDDSF